MLKQQNSGFLRSFDKQTISPVNLITRFIYQATKVMIFE